MTFRGYHLGKEDFEQLDNEGMSCSEMLLAKRKQAAWPSAYNPADILKVYAQSVQGACQGHSVALAVQVCCFLSTGRIYEFSRAAGYYLSQKIDNIRGDNGSTLSAGRKLASEHGLCLEKYWPYPDRYNPTQPAGLTEFPFKVKASKRITNVDEAWEMLRNGFPIQTGISWTKSCDVEVLDNYQYNERSGGHSTLLWGLDPNGNAINNNSWSEAWQGDGRQTWTRRAFEEMLRGRWNVFIGYMPHEMVHPKFDIIQKVV